MQKTCTTCGSGFSIPDEDIRFYAKVSPVIGDKRYDFPPPTHCSACRQQRRLAFRNELNLHHRKCDMSGRQIVSMYAEGIPYVIVDQDIWWSDAWDPLEYGQTFDPLRSFFDQFQDLRQRVPRMSLNVLFNENSYYTNYALYNKNSYLVYTADYNEQCYYGRFSDRNFDSCDFDFTYDSMQCYEVIDMHRCNRCFYAQKCNDCSELAFCYDMRNCSDCLFCGNLRGKRYHIFNEPVAKEEYLRMRNELFTKEALPHAIAKYQTFLYGIPRQPLDMIQCEDCEGDYLQTSQRAVQCFDGYDLQDVKNGSHLFGSKDSYDWDFVGERGSELCCEMVSSTKSIRSLCCMNVWEGNNELLYCDLCVGCQNCFGCVGLRKKDHCILNRQYTKEQYDELVPKLIVHMQKIREWGEFFPPSMSPFGYNESVASEYYPLEKKQVQALRWNWHEEIPAKEKYLGPAAVIPDDLQSAPETLCDLIFTCEETGKPYKIISQELAFHKKLGLPLPRVCPLQRHWNRRGKRNPRVLCNRSCAKCGTKIRTTYQPTGPEVVYCESCYLSSVY